ncbi:MAG TPA: Nif3-like dinuclear metal center hexameric protein, partial [Lacipirellulaceae bacterium]
MSALSLSSVIAWLEEIAPLELAEEWDNVGLLVGDRAAAAERVMTCLTVTPATAAEAIERRADLIVVHHPLPFRPLAQVTTDATTGRLLWDLIGARVAVFSAHTAFDSARTGINQQLAEKLGLTHISPLLPRPASGKHPELGSGRRGVFDRPLPLAGFAECVKSTLATTLVSLIGEDARPVQRIAIACGSGGTFLAAARDSGCECLITGEANFHACLEAEACGMGLVLAGHFAS